MKLKVLIISMGLFLWIINGKAQNRGFLALSAGPSFPMGDFDSKDLKNTESGFAKMGEVIDLSCNYKLGDDFGVCALYRHQRNPVDESALIKEFNSKYSPVTFSVSSDSWLINTFMGGIFVGSQLSEKLRIEIKFLIGYAFAESPQILLRGTGPNGSIPISTNSAKGEAMSTLFGADFRYDISNKTCLIFGLDYLNSKPDFTDVITTSNNGYFKKDNYSQKFQTLNIHVGLGRTF